MSNEQDGTPSIPTVILSPDKSSAEMDVSSNASSSGSENGDSQSMKPPSTKARLQRPRLNNRKSSGTIIIPSNSAQIEMQDERYDEDDARTMSPRKTSEEIEKMGQEARQALIDQAKALQESLLSICERVESVRCEHEKLEGGNKFLQSYIGELMQTSKITSTSGSKSKGKARS